MLKIVSGLQSVYLAFGVAAAFGDVVSTPDRLFGLGEVRQIAVSSDLEYLATGGQGGAFLWDLNASSLQKRIEGDWAITALAFSPSTNLLCVASRGTIQGWDAATGERVQEFRGHTAEISRLAFSANGDWLVSASGDNSVRVWSVQTGEQLHSVRTPGSPLLDVAISRDSRWLATVDTFLTNCVKIWDIGTESLVQVLPKTNWTAQRCWFAPDGSILVATPDRRLTLWNTETAEEIRNYEGITGNTALVMDAWFPNGDSLGAVCNDGTIYLWNFASGDLVKTVPGEPVFAAIGVPGDFLTIGAPLDNNVRIRQLPGGDTLRTFKGHTTSVHSGVAFSPDGHYVLSGGTETATRLWDRKTGQAVREFIGSPAGTMTACFSPDGSRILTTSGAPNPGALLWRTETGELEREFHWSNQWPMAAVFSPDGTKIAVRSQGESIRIINVESGDVLATLATTSWGGPMAFATGAPWLLAGSSESAADLYNYETQQRLHTFSANAGAVVAVAFSPAMDLLMIGWADGLIRVYDPATKEMRREMVTAAFLESAAFSPNGNYILAGEGWPLLTATLWDARTAQALRRFSGHKWAVTAVAFSPDGQSILTGADIVREWSIADIVPDLRVEKRANGIELRWSSGELQHAPNVAGPWQGIPNAISPWSVPTAEHSGFYRVHVAD